MSCRLKLILVCIVKAGREQAIKYSLEIESKASITTENQALWPFQDRLFLIKTVKIMELRKEGTR
jgi:hypothetical protein